MTLKAAGVGAVSSPRKPVKVKNSADTALLAGARKSDVRSGSPASVTMGRDTLVRVDRSRIMWKRAAMDCNMVGM